AASTLKAQDTTTSKLQNEYAYVYYYYDTAVFVNCLGIYYEDGTKEKFQIPRRFGSDKVILRFDVYTKAFHSLENKGYELVSISNESNPFYIFKRKRKNN